MDLNEIVDGLFAAAEAGDWTGFRAAFADDAVLCQNVGRENSIDDAIPGLRALTDNGTSLRYDRVRRLVGDRHVTEMHDAVFTKPDGSVVSIDICVIMQFNDAGLVVRADEYLNALDAAALMA